MLEKCVKCKNKHTEKCEIHRTIDGSYKCVEYEEEKDEELD